MEIEAFVLTPDTQARSALFELGSVPQAWPYTPTVHTDRTDNLKQTPPCTHLQLHRTNRTGKQRTHRIIPNYFCLPCPTFWLSAPQRSSPKTICLFSLALQTFPTFPFFQLFPFILFSLFSNSFSSLGRSLSLFHCLAKSNLWFALWPIIHRMLQI